VKKNMLAKLTFQIFIFWRNKNNSVKKIPKITELMAKFKYIGSPLTDFYFQPRNTRGFI